MFEENLTCYYDGGHKKIKILRRNLKKVADEDDEEEEDERRLFVHIFPLRENI